MSVSFRCICLCEKGGLHLSLHVLDTWTNKGRRRYEERCVETNRGFAVPTPLVPAILSGTWTPEEGTLQRQLPLIFHTVCQTLLQVAQCTLFVMWGQVYSGWYIL